MGVPLKFGVRGQGDFHKRFKPPKEVEGGEKRGGLRPPQRGWHKGVWVNGGEHLFVHGGDTISVVIRGALSKGAP